MHQEIIVHDYKDEEKEKEKAMRVRSNAEAKRTEILRLHQPLTNATTSATVRLWSGLKPVQLAYLQRPFPALPTKAPQPHDATLATFSGMLLGEQRCLP